MTKETYEITVICENCDFRGKADIERGTLVKNAPCPRCGNKTLRKALPGETIFEH